MILDNASGAIVSISDGANGMNARSLVAAFSPIQDLHGQTSPYPAGGGKNLWRPDNYEDKSNQYNSVSLNGDEYTMTWTNGTIVFYINKKYMYPAGTYVCSGVGTNLNLVRLYFYNEEGTLHTSVYLNAQTTVTLSEPCYVGVGGNYANPTTAVFKGQIELGSSATSYAPYSNICPISGRTGLIVSKTRKNLLGGNTLRDAIKESIPSATDYPNERYIEFSAGAASDISISDAAGMIFKSGTRYTFIMTLYTTKKKSNLLIGYDDDSYTSIIGTSLEDVKSCGLSHRFT